jgi:dTDP-4-amino-4,6-dideoxygalactose transaminase
MFITNPDPFLLPSFRISPFLTSSLDRNLAIEDRFSSVCIEYFNQRFGEGNWMLTYNGREGIKLALESMQLPQETCVSILTPSNNKYISSCVTSTIEKSHTWNRHKSSNTSAFLVNHEFGYIYKNMEDLLEEGLPVLEDCCTTFFSQDEKNKVGKYGKFSVYSFPKFFAIQIGGLLVGERVGECVPLSNASVLSQAESHYILKVIGYEWDQVNQLLEKRKSNFEYAVSSFSSLGFSLRFPDHDLVVPSALLLNNHGIITDLPQLKKFLNAHGIQNSIFYGEDAFFLPCHQNLSKADIDYFAFVVTNYILSQN